MKVNVFSMSKFIDKGYHILVDRTGIIMQKLFNDGASHAVRTSQQSAKMIGLKVIGKIEKCAEYMIGKTKQAGFHFKITGEAERHL